MTLYLTNPGKRRTRDKRGRFVKGAKSKRRRRKAVGVTRRSTRKRRGSRMARRRNAKGRFVKGGGSRRRRRRSAAAPARRRRRRSSPARRRTRRYRRNPPRLSGMVRTLTDGATGALAAIVGKAAARAIPQQFGLSTAGTMGLATQGAVALVIGMVASKLPAARKHAPFMVAGALMAPMEDVVRSLNIPVLSPALSAYPGYPMLPSGGPALSGHVRAGLASYAHPDN